MNLGGKETTVGLKAKYGKKVMPLYHTKAFGYEDIFVQTMQFPSSEHSNGAYHNFKIY